MQIIFQQKFNNNLDLTIRYPVVKDSLQLQTYINTLSQEKTYIRKQGKIVSLEDEQKYLTNVLEKIDQHKLVQLLVFHDEQLIGNSNVELENLAQRHIADFGISLKKEYRGKGIGTLLMKTILKEAQNKLPGLEIIKLTVHAPNKIAQKMYKNLGFKEFGRLPNGVKLDHGYRDHILMYKMVDSN